MMEQARLSAVWPMENWLGSSLNQIQGWTTVRESYSPALEQPPLAVCMTRRPLLLLSETGSCFQRPLSLSLSLSLLICVGHFGRRCRCVGLSERIVVESRPRILHDLHIHRVFQYPAAQQQRPAPTGQTANSRKVGLISVDDPVLCHLTFMVHM